MASLSRTEQYILAPSDPAWGDERNRDEFYRASAVGFFWSVYAFLVVAIIAAFQGAVVASLAAALMPGVLQIWAVQGYCRRHDVAYLRLSAAFNTGYRRRVALGTMLPLYLRWMFAMAKHVGLLDGDVSTIAGAVTGAVCGGAAAWVAFLIARRRPEGPSEPDDVFDD